MFVRIKVYIQFNLRTFFFLCGTLSSYIPAPHTQFRERKAYLSSPLAGICCIFSGFISFCLPVRFLTERLTQGYDHGQLFLRFSVERILIEKLEDGEAKR